MEAAVVQEMKANIIQWEHLEFHASKKVNHKVIHIYTQMTDLFLHFFPFIKYTQDDNPHFPKFQGLLTLNLSFTTVLMSVTFSAGCLDKSLLLVETLVETVGKH